MRGDRFVELKGSDIELVTSCEGAGVTERHFAWDSAKSRRNERKHRVSFNEAETVWDDPNRIEAPDEEHSETEIREITIGLSSRLRLLTVVYTQRNEVIRIISARRANQAETRRYTGEA